APSVVRDHPYGKVPNQQERINRVVLTYGGGTAQQVADATPPQANVIRHSFVKRNLLGFPGLNVQRPLSRVLVWRRAQPGKERKLKVIVCIHQPWKDEI